MASRASLSAVSLRGALLPQLDAGIGVDAVINAAVAGDIAPGHTTVGGVDDGITAQGGDVPAGVRGNYAGAGPGGRNGKGEDHQGL